MERPKSVVKRNWLKPSPAVGLDYKEQKFHITSVLTACSQADDGISPQPMSPSSSACPALASHILTAFGYMLHMYFIDRC